MSADDLIPCSFTPPVMSSPALYLSFKRVRKESIATTQDETHLKNRPPASEDSFGEAPPMQVSVVGCSSRDTVNPSPEPLGLGVGIGAPGDRGRVFNTNTKMKATISNDDEQSTNGGEAHE